MTPRDFAEYAALWREQVDPKELAELQAMATKIKRTARRRLLFDYLGLIWVAAMTCLFVLRHPAPLVIKLCLALIIMVGPMWFMWRRRQVAEAARAIAIDDPKVFFEAAIENVRAEIKLSTVNAWSVAPIFTAWCLVTGAERGFDRLYIAFRDLFTLDSVGLTLFVVISILAIIYFTRDIFRLREQLRRLEAMRREWDEREPGEEP